MTDEQIIKAFEVYYEQDNDMLLTKEVKKAILDLIKRQQAEIEELTERLQEYKSFPCFTNDTQVVTVSKKADGQYCADRVTTIQIDKIRAEAYKEFAERLMDINSSGYILITEMTLDNLVKELTEGSNDTRRMD